MSQLQSKGTQCYHCSLCFAGRVILCYSYTFPPGSVGITDINLHVFWFIQSQLWQERKLLKRSAFIWVFTTNAFVPDQPKFIRVGWKPMGWKSFKNWFDEVGQEAVFYLQRWHCRFAFIGYRSLNCSSWSWDGFSVRYIHPLPSPLVCPWETASRVRWTGCEG